MKILRSSLFEFSYLGKNNKEKRNVYGSFNLL